jgi:hypothetical protein
MSAIAKALHEVMSKVSYVQKSGKNAFHNYKYAGEADLLEVLRPAMVEAGLLLIPSVETISEVDASGNVFVQVAYTLAHKDGEVWPHKVVAAGCGNDMAKSGKTGDKGVYKAITGANKYLLFKLFQIETGDDPEKTEAAIHEEAAPPVEKYASKASKATADGLITDFKASATLDALVAIRKGKDFIIEWSKLLEDDQNRVQTAYGDRKAELEGA